MEMKKLIAQDREMLLRQFAIDFNLPYAEVQAYTRATRLHPVRPLDSDDRRESESDEDSSFSSIGRLVLINDFLKGNFSLSEFSESESELISG